MALAQIVGARISGTRDIDTVTYYTIAVNDRNGTRTVERRYNEFATLHAQLSQFGVQLPQMPEKSVFRKMFSPNFLREREANLDQLLQAALHACAMQSQSATLLETFLGLVQAGGQPGYSQSAQHYQASPAYAQPGYAQAPAGLVYGQGLPANGQPPAMAYGQPAPVYAQPAPAYGQPAPGFGGTDRVVENVRPHGLFGTEEVVEEVRTDRFGNREVRDEVVDKDMFGRVTGVREETVEEPRMMGGMMGGGRMGGFERGEENVRRHGFFGTEEVVEDVRTDRFGNREVREEIVDKDMFGRVTGVREETVEEPSRMGGMFGGMWGEGQTDRVVENVRPHGFFGSEQVVEEVRTDRFGNREVREEIVDKDMFGRLTGVREEVVDRDIYGDVTIRDDRW